MNGIDDESRPVVLRRKDVYRVLARRTGLKAAQVSALLAAAAELTSDQLQAFGKFELPHLCLFKLHERPARRVALRGFQTRIGKRQVLRVNASKRLRDEFFSLLE